MGVGTTHASRPRGGAPVSGGTGVVAVPCRSTPRMPRSSLAPALPEAGSPHASGGAISKALTAPTSLRDPEPSDSQVNTGLAA